MRRLVRLATLGAALASAPAARATVVQEPTLEQAVALASDIILGVVTATAAVREPGGAIHTETFVRIEQRIAGAGAVGDRLRVRHLGGRVGDEVVIVPGMPTFEPGERVLLFLTRAPDGSHRTLGLFVGVYRVLPGESGEVVVREPAGDATLVPTRVCCALPERMALAELLRRLADARGAR